MFSYLGEVSNSIISLVLKIELSQIIKKNPKMKKKQEVSKANKVCSDAEEYETCKSWAYIYRRAKNFRTFKQDIQMEVKRKIKRYEALLENFLLEWYLVSRVNDTNKL